MSPNTTVYDSDINPVLKKASDEDLQPLVELLTNTFTNILDSQDVYKKNKNNPHVYVDLIAKEICEFGGNSFVNVFRGKGPDYKEIVGDVAKKLKISFDANASVSIIENAIIEKVLVQALSKMSESEKQVLLSDLGNLSAYLLKGSALTASIITLFQTSSAASYQLSTVVAAATMKMAVGSSLKFASAAIGARLGASLIGPIGLALTSIWLAIDIAGPAYRITIPAVIYIAMLRKAQALD